jgi:probable F420-dependent oxidoreductase
MTKLHGTGIWSGHLRYGDAAAAAATAAELDAFGYSAIWIPDVGGDVFGAVENLLGATTRATIATGILNIWMHEPAEVAARQHERFLLGLGVSHAALIKQYDKPLAQMVAYVDALDAAGCLADRRVLAALRPRMIELARDRASGIHPYFVPAEHVARARTRLGPDRIIAVELAVVLDTNPSSARETARRHTAIYVTLPNYTNNLRDFGFADDDFADKGSDRLVDAIVAWGSIDDVARRVQALRDAGADHVCIQVIRPDDEMPIAEWRELAPAMG